ncbi:hypothetical protein C8R46DRAFT_1035545 [Mycena filopes]|nr:hypothetical protein C8R46DRAFT_1035545 [Mycena filopes]
MHPPSRWHAPTFRPQSTKIQWEARSMQAPVILEWAVIFLNQVIIPAQGLEFLECGGPVYSGMPVRFGCRSLISLEHFSSSHSTAGTIFIRSLSIIFYHKPHRPPPSSSSSSYSEFQIEAQTLALGDYIDYTINAGAPFGTPSRLTLDHIDLRTLHLSHSYLVHPYVRLTDSRGRQQPTTLFALSPARASNDDFPFVVRSAAGSRNGERDTTAREYANLAQKKALHPTVEAPEQGPLQNQARTGGRCNPSKETPRCCEPECRVVVGRRGGWRRGRRDDEVHEEGPTKEIKVVLGIGGGCGIGDSSRRRMKSDFAAQVRSKNEFVLDFDGEGGSATSIGDRRGRMASSGGAFVEPIVGKVTGLQIPRKYVASALRLYMPSPFTTSSFSTTTTQICRVDYVHWKFGADLKHYLKPLVSTLSGLEDCASGSTSAPKCHRGLAPPGHRAALSSLLRPLSPKIARHPSLFAPMPLVASRVVPSRLETHGAVEGRWTRRTRAGFGGPTSDECCREYLGVHYTTIVITARVCTVRICLDSTLSGNG